MHVHPYQFQVRYILNAIGQFGRWLPAVLVLLALPEGYSRSFYKVKMHLAGMLSILASYLLILR